MSHMVEASSRAGFWRRVAALLIDFCLVTAVLTIIGVSLFAPTNGRVRISSPLIYAQSCVGLDLNGLGNLGGSLPENFRVTQASRCTRSLFGFMYDRFLFVSEVSRPGNITYTRQFNIPVDAEWRPASVFDLASISIPLIALYLVITQWRFGRSIGMQLLKIGVRSLSGQSPSLLQVIKRIAVLVAPWILTDVVGSLTLNYGFVGVWLFIFALACLVAAAFIINIIWTVSRRNLPWHDRFAGTEVFHGWTTARPPPFSVP